VRACIEVKRVWRKEEEKEGKKEKVTTAGVF